MTTFGPAYDERLDGRRLHRQMDRIRDFMLGLGKRGLWLTLREISLDLSYPEASVSAQLRHLKKARFGGYQMNKRRRSKGTWEYQVLEPLPKEEQMQLYREASAVGIQL